MYLCKMAYTESTMLPLGTEAPEFSLPDVVSGNLYSLDQLASKKATVIMFICNHCPYVIHVLPEMIKLAQDYKSRDVAFVAISSNDAIRYPDDAPDKMKIKAKSMNFPFVYLYDETQAVAKSYDAACTPDFYLFDGSRKLVYRGRLDQSKPKNDLPLNGQDLRRALDQVLSGFPVSEKQYPSAGCSIKWK